MTELKDRLGHLGKDELILDVRTAEEFAEGHVQGSRNITHEDVADIAEELKKYKAVYIHCRSGKRAQVAVAELTKLGVNNLVCVSQGGMMEWIEKGYPVVHS